MRGQYTGNDDHVITFIAHGMMISKTDDIINAHKK